ARHKTAAAEAARVAAKIRSRETPRTPLRAPRGGARTPRPRDRATNARATAHAANDRSDTRRAARGTLRGDAVLRPCARAAREADPRNNDRCALARGGSPIRRSPFVRGRVE